MPTRSAPELGLPVRPLPDAALTPAAVADICDLAARLIDDNGLCVGEFWDHSLVATRWSEGRSCCAIGALGVAAGYRDYYDVDAVMVGELVYDFDAGHNVQEPVHPALAALMAQLGVRDAVDVMTWSDKADAATVAAELRAAAAALRLAAAGLSEVARRATPAR